MYYIISTVILSIVVILLIIFYNENNIIQFFKNKYFDKITSMFDKTTKKVTNLITNIKTKNKQLCIVAQLTYQDSLNILQFLPKYIHSQAADRNHRDF